MEPRDSSTRMKQPTSNGTLMHQTHLNHLNAICANFANVSSCVFPLLSSCFRNSIAAVGRHVLQPLASLSSLRTLQGCVHPAHLLDPTACTGRAHLQLLADVTQTCPKP